MPHRVAVLVAIPYVVSGMRTFFMLISLSLAGLAVAEDRWRFQAELGITSVQKNVVAYPGDTGTKFSLRPFTRSSGLAVPRIRAIHSTPNDSEWIILVAPFSTNGTGTSAQNLNFGGQNFSAGTPIQANYRFDSYRLTYRKRAAGSPATEVYWGATLKLRDASVSLRQGGVNARTANTGFVPLAHVLVRQNLGNSWGAELEIDGAAAPQGRAIDANLRLSRHFGPRSEVFLSLRYFEGGADNDEVYSFGEFRSIGLGATFRF